MNEMTCHMVRDMVQTAYEKNIELSPEVLYHLGACTSCNRFSIWISTVGGRMKKDLDKKIKGCSPADIYAIKKGALVRKRQRRIRYCLSGVAAALIIAAIGVLGNNAVQEARIKNSVNEEINYFVDDLFSQSLGEEIEYIAVSEWQ